MAAAAPRRCGSTQRPLLGFSSGPPPCRFAGWVEVERDDDEMIREVPSARGSGGRGHLSEVVGWRCLPPGSRSVGAASRRLAFGGTTRRPPRCTCRRNSCWPSLTTAVGPSFSTPPPLMQPLHSAFARGVLTVFCVTCAPAPAPAPLPAPAPWTLAPPRSRYRGEHHTGRGGGGGRGRTATSEGGAAKSCRAQDGRTGRAPSTPAHVFGTLMLPTGPLAASARPAPASTATGGVRGTCTGRWLQLPRAGGRPLPVPRATARFSARARQQLRRTCACALSVAG